MSYELLFTVSASQRDELRLQAGTLECQGCGTGTDKPKRATRPPATLGPWALLPDFFHVMVLRVSSPNQLPDLLADKGASGAAAGALSVTVKGAEPGHVVVALHWSDVPAPLGVRCENCPPGTEPTRWIEEPAGARGLVPLPTKVFVLGFYSAEAADAWVASTAGTEALASALYVRLFLQP